MEVVKKGRPAAVANACEEMSTDTLVL